MTTVRSLLCQDSKKRQLYDSVLFIPLLAAGTSSLSRPNLDDLPGQLKYLRRMRGGDLCEGGFQSHFCGEAVRKLLPAS